MALAGRHPPPPADTRPPSSGPSSLARRDQTPSPSHPSGSSRCTSPAHPVSCVEPGLAICFTYGNIHASMPFSHSTGVGCHRLLPLRPSTVLIWADTTGFRNSNGCGLGSFQLRSGYIWKECRAQYIMRALSMCFIPFVF